MELFFLNLTLYLKKRITFYVFGQKYSTCIKLVNSGTAKRGCRNSQPSTSEQTNRQMLLLVPFRAELRWFKEL